MMQNELGISRVPENWRRLCGNFRDRQCLAPLDAAASLVPAKISAAGRIDPSFARSLRRLSDRGSVSSDLGAAAADRAAGIDARTAAARLAARP